MSDPEHFVFLLLEDFSHLAFANAVEPLRIANLVSERELYRWSFAAAEGSTVRSSNGTVMQVEHDLSNLPDCDRVFVLSGVNVKKHTTRTLVAGLRRLKRHGVPLGALCSGAFALAQAGLLDGQPAAIHWDFHDSFTEEFPDVSLLPNVFVADAPIVSASGGTATADLILHLITQTHGEDLSIAVADQMVYTAVRDDTAQQRVSIQSRAGGRSPRLSQAIKIMRGAVEERMPVAEVARQAGVSTRQLERLFGKHLNTSPKRYMMNLRLERARHLLVQTEMSVVEVAIACGFENPGHFSRIYRASYGVSPMQQRRTIA